MTNEAAAKIIKDYDVLSCGYCHEGGDEIPEAFDMAVKALLNNTKEPRMMTLDEVKAAKGSGTPVYVEDVKESYSEMAFVSVVDGFDEWVHISFHGERSIFGKRCREYGVKWRCWTSKPTNKQRKEAKWDG